MPAPPVSFAVAADALRRQEIARLSDALTPRIEALRSMMLPAFRVVVATMLERFGHAIINDPSAPELVTTKNGVKFITACARPTAPAPTGTRDLARLHDAVLAANAQRGFFITARSFTDAAMHYAESAPLDLIDGARLIKALNQSRKHVLLPQSYKAMCQQCGAIVEHRIDRDQDEARPCSNGHLVAPTIARASLVPFRAPPQPPQQPASAPQHRPATAPHTGGGAPQSGSGNAAKAARVIKPKNMSPKAVRRRQIRAHNLQRRARAFAAAPGVKHGGG